jgi:glycosyltransferase involved in cell wall biosynthesis
VRVLIAIDHHFVRDRAGEVYVGHPYAIAGYPFWQQYLRVFEEVVVLARVRRQIERPAKGVVAGGPRVSFHDLPDYLGPWEYFYHLARLRRRVGQAVDRSDAFILRVPGAIGQLAWKELRHSGRPYGLEVVADPWDMYSPGAVPTIVRPIVRRHSSTLLRAMCSEAPCVSYVTREALQRRYPPGPGTWATYASDVDIQTGVADSSEIQERVDRLGKISCEGGGGSPGILIGFVGAFAQMYKAPDVLLQSAARCLRADLNFTVVFVGDGKYRLPMEALASELGISDRVRFLGVLPPGRAVREFLSQVDLFVLPSRQEGLPRAMVEAMAQGCPCIGSTVGGIPELLATEDLVPPGDAGALAAKIREVLREPGRLERMARRNLERAKDFQPDTLLERRLSFYSKVREQAEQLAGSRLVAVGDN